MALIVFIVLVGYHSQADHGCSTLVLVIIWKPVLAGVRWAVDSIDQCFGMFNKLLLEIEIISKSSKGQ